MDWSAPLLLSLGIGVVAGLRAMTAPAVVAWAAHLGWLDLSRTNLSFMGSKWAVGIFTVAAIGELVNDQLPKTPPRTAAGPLIARIVMGAIAGICVASSNRAGMIFGGVLGATGAVAGAYGGYYARTGLVRRLRVPDFVVAIPEDLIAIAVALLIV